jgi:hypothetical protein
LEFIYHLFFQVHIALSWGLKCANKLSDSCTTC